MKKVFYSLIIILSFCFCLNVKADQCTINFETQSKCNNYCLDNGNYVTGSDSCNAKCVWLNNMCVEEPGYDYMACGSIEDFPARIPKITRTIYKIIKYGIPIVLVLLGTLDFAKAVIASDESEMKKGQKKFTRRLIAACTVLLVFSVVQIFMSFLGKWNDDTSIYNCARCLTDDASYCGTTISVN